MTMSGTSSKVSKHFDAQAELNRLIAERLTAVPLATCLGMSAHLRVWPDEERTALLDRFVVCLWVVAQYF
jgi:hypothetical protein